MSDKIEGVHETVGPSLPVAPSLAKRISAHSPELVALMQKHLLDTGADHLTYDGTDASIRIALHVIEALLALEQLRMEVEDQVYRSREGKPAIHHLEAMHMHLGLEPVLLQAAKTALELNDAVWDIKGKW